jgi:hypothetical protein
MASLRDAAARGAAAYGRVEHVRAFLGECGVELLHDARRIGGQVEIGRAGFYTAHKSIRSERDRFHIGRLRQGREDHIALACERARGIGPDGAGIEMMTGRLPLQVVDDQPEASLLQVGGHAAAHDAQPDESPPPLCHSYCHHCFGSGL